LSLFRVDEGFTKLLSLNYDMFLDHFIIERLSMHTPYEGSRKRKYSSSHAKYWYGFFSILVKEKKCKGKAPFYGACELPWPTDE
jgi:hypothetical protein